MFATTALLQRQGPGHRQVVQRGGPRAQEHQDGHALQAVVRRQQPAVPHPQQHRHRTVTYKNGKVVLAEKCFDIAPVDPELAKTRVWEKKFNLNTGK